MCTSEVYFYQTQSIGTMVYNGVLLHYYIYLLVNNKVLYHNLN